METVKMAATKDNYKNTGVLVDFASIGSETHGIVLPTDFNNHPILEPHFIVLMGATNYKLDDIGSLIFYNSIEPEKLKGYDFSWSNMKKDDIKIILGKDIAEFLQLYRPKPDYSQIIINILTSNV